MLFGPHHASKNLPLNDHFTEIYPQILAKSHNIYPCNESKNLAIRDFDGNFLSCLPRRGVSAVSFAFLLLFFLTTDATRPTHMGRTIR